MSARRIRAWSVRSRRGFTLIELLVVVAIIALLISILLPSLARARDQGKSTVCKSNVHQIALALHMYTHEEKYYPGHHENTSISYIWWPRRLLPYAGKANRVFWCPSAPKDTYWNGTDPILPSALAARYRPGTIGTFAYGYNDWGVREFTNPHLGLGGWTGHKTWGEPKADRIVNPSEMISIGDNNSDGVWDTALDPDEADEPPGDRHHRGANIAFGDGHAQWYLQKKITARTLDIRRMWNNDNKPHKELWQ